MTGISAMPPNWNQNDSGAKGFEFKDLRSLFGFIDEDLIWISGRANHLVSWSKAHQYCGSCGYRTRDKSDERAKICPQCGLINFPRLSPAIIVAILKENKILLARNKRFKIPFYSVLAGFVEPGETLEECVEREVLEEVGIIVKNIRYFGSQSWLFRPSCLLRPFVRCCPTVSDSLQARWSSWSFFSSCRRHMHGRMRRPLGSW